MRNPRKTRLELSLHVLDTPEYFTEEVLRTAAEIVLELGEEKDKALADKTLRSLPDLKTSWSQPSIYDPASAKPPAHYPLQTAILWAFWTAAFVWFILAVLLLSRAP